MGDKQKPKKDSGAGPEVMTEETREYLLEKLGLIADLNRMAISDYKALFVELQRLRAQNGKLLGVIDGQSAVIRQLITQKPAAPAEAGSPRRSRKPAQRTAIPDQTPPQPSARDHSKEGSPA